MLQRTEEVEGSAGALQTRAARTERAEEDRKHDIETMESWRKARQEQQIHGPWLTPD